MAENNAKKIEELTVELNNLYREETFTDLRVATIRRLTPVKPDGSDDESREPVFTGQAHVLTPVGPLPIQCHIKAKSLEEAVKKFPESVKKAAAQMVEEIKELKRREASRIVLPGEGPKNITLA